jgi:hypothetical protein
MLKRKANGAWSISSRQDLADALDQRADIQFKRDDAYQMYVDRYDAEIADLTEAIDNFILSRYDAGDGFENDNWKATHVQGHRRSWDVSKLEKLLPRGIFKNVVKITADPQKIDEYVRAKKINMDDIQEAYVETPNKPYTKVTAKSTARGEAEAESLAAKLG